MKLDQDGGLNMLMGAWGGDGGGIDEVFFQSQFSWIAVQSNE